MSAHPVCTTGRVETVRKGLSAGMTHDQIAVFAGMPKGAIAGMADRLRASKPLMSLNRVRTAPRTPALVETHAAFWEGMAPGCRSYSDFHHAMRGAPTSRFLVDERDAWMDRKDKARETPRL